MISYMSASSKKQKGTYISKTTITRIIKDVRELRKNPLASHGIYYQHDQDDMLTGRALIIGPTDTPYSYGAYFLKLKCLLITLMNHQSLVFILMMVILECIQTCTKIKSMFRYFKYMVW